MATDYYTRRLLEALVRTDLVVVVIVFHLVCSLRAQELGMKECNSSATYLNLSANECTPCTNCGDLGLLTFINCSSTSDSVCYADCPVNQYYDNSTGACTNCTVSCPTGPVASRCTTVQDTVCHTCPVRTYFNKNSGACTPCSNCSSSVKAECTATRDTECCGDKEFFNSAVMACTPDCTKCPLGRCQKQSEYHCECPACRIGTFCDVPDPGCMATEPSPTDGMVDVTRPTEPESVPISPVASALIALGAVIGIILFSALFVLLGVVTSCNRGSSTQGADSSSSNSSERILDDSKASSLLISMSKHNSMTYNEYRASLDFLRLSGSGRSLGSPASSTSPRNSPSSTRSTPTKHRDKNWAVV